jgi:hypothetical protein
MNIPTGATNLVAISAGDDHCLALRADGTVFAWGDNSYGQNGIPAGLKNVVAIADSGYHCLALVADNTPRRQAMMVSPSYSNGIFSVSVPTLSGKVYLFEYKDSLGGDWQSLPLTAGNGKTATLTDKTASGATRFYRVREW